uniref:Uncharacterized protein n=1 Tax=Tetranychus urticae TaxID=32264 RepID=T1KF13_TETUR
MVKLRGKIEKPKLTDILEEAPTKARVLRGLLILGTGIATMLAYKAIAESKMVDDTYNAGMERYYEGIKARDEYIASVIREHSEPKAQLDGQKSDPKR